MRILLDENMPHGFRALLVGHDVFTVQWLGWGAVKNGDLLRKADGQFELLITVDRGIKYQNNFSDKKISLVTMVTKGNRMRDLSPFAPTILNRIENLTPGSVINLTVNDLW